MRAKHGVRTAWTLVLSIVAGAAAAARLSAQAPARDNEARQIFLVAVKPLLQAKCQGCHGAAKVSDLSVENREGLLGGGKRGPSITPGDPSASVLVTAIEQQGPLKMPPGGKLSEKEIAAVRRWVELGAPWFDVLPATPVDAQNSNDLWAFRKLRHYDPPHTSHAAANSVDAFVYEKIESKSVQPARRADRRTLIRRATFDLTGLPPTPAQAASFLNDPASDRDAYGKLIEHLLASPHYGERWGRHWLDVVRYADTAGYSNDFERPNAWRYREYVIRSFNQDKPYDQFVREQIAGDELDPTNPEYLVATGFLRMGPWEHTAMSVAAETRQLWLDDVTHTTGTTFLGLTVECARCHDHKFDPLPTKDYYSLQAIFATTEFADRPAPFLASERRDDFDAGRKSLEELTRRNQARLAIFDDLIKKRLAAKRGVTSVDQLPADDVAAEIKKRDLLAGEEMEHMKVYEKRRELYVRSSKRYSPIAYSVSNGPLDPKEQKSWSPPDVFILPVGNLKTPGEKVQPAVFSALGHYSDEPAPAVPPASTARRLALANWIVDSRNPLTARVMVNRIWQYHFGTGIAANPNNLGKMGKKPTQPELLDFLAEYFIQHGWSVKAMHRLIMMSDCYQRDSIPADADQLEKADPQNELLSFFPPRRLESEELRDTILAVSGELSHDTGGPGTFPEINHDVSVQPQQIMGTLMPAYRPSPRREQRHRRTIYAFAKRNLSDPFLEVFNGPSLDASTERRIATTIPTQVFALFNSEFVHDMALAFANRIAASAKTPDVQIRALFNAALNRLPDEEEVRLARLRLQQMIEYHRRVSPPAKPVRKPPVRSITSELTGAEVRIEEEEDAASYEENLQPADVSPEIRALADMALALFNTNEFVYVY
jgi:mono/diheme cytochrome c family protein